MSSSNFLYGGQVPETPVGTGVTRQILGYDDSIMLVRVCFEEGAEGYLHSHPHSQVTYVESGQFDFTVGAETRSLGPGDCTYIPPGAEHGTVCREAGVLVDVFSPLREDFLTEGSEE